MDNVLHKASQRGFANHGWLRAAHLFSFANYYDNEKVHFGLLRVLNDDIVAPSRGFDLHPHQDMEIITIPLSGSLLHSDNMGHQEVIKAGEVQVMSAGSGVWHSEHNASDSEELNLFQIWIFTNQKKHKPRYDQKMFSAEDRYDSWQLLVGPKGKSEQLWIHQDAYISVIQSAEKEDFQYQLQSQGNGVYFMLEDGNAIIENLSLEKRDAAGFWNFFDPLSIHLKKDSKLLAIEVPMR
jgi:redox-sensitive bicupin YhaK (pirin superfamily)